MTLKQWVLASGLNDTVALLHAAFAKPITGYNDWIETRTRDFVTVQAEKFAKAIATDAGIVLSDTLSQCDTKLRAMIANTAAADKPLAVYKAAAFWTAYFQARNIAASGADTETINHHDTILGQSPAQINGWGTITGDDIERAMLQ